MNVSPTIQFLNESNRIEGIRDIDYQALEFQDPTKGHFGAYVASKQQAESRDELTVKMIRTWQGMLTTEQKEHTGDSIAEEEIGRIRGPSLQRNVSIDGHFVHRFRPIRYA